MRKKVKAATLKPNEKFWAFGDEWHRAINSCYDGIRKDSDGFRVCPLSPGVEVEVEVITVPLETVPLGTKVREGHLEGTVVISSSGFRYILDGGFNIVSPGNKAHVEVLS